MSDINDFVSENPGRVALAGGLLIKQGQEQQARDQAKLLEATKAVQAQLAQLQDAEKERARLEAAKYKEAQEIKFRLQCAKFILASAISRRVLCS